MRYLIILLSAAFIAGCASQEKSDPVHKFISTSSILACNQTIQLGDKVEAYQLSGENISHNEEVDSYYISCEDGGAMMIGEESDGSQIFFIKNATFSISKDSVISQLMGSWLADAVESGMNDIQKARYEIEQSIGPASSIRPLTWETPLSTLQIGNQRLQYGTEVYFVSSSIKSTQ